MPTGWNVGEEGTLQRRISNDLKKVLHAGLRHFSCSELECLPGIIGDPEDSGNPEPVRACLVTLLVKRDSGLDPQHQWDELTPHTRANLTLFRAVGAVEPLKQGEARVLAAREIKARAKTAPGVAKAGGVEHKLVGEVVDDLVRLHVKGPTSGPTRDRREQQPQREDNRPGPPVAPQLYVPLTAAETAKGFWWREDTKKYVRILARLESLTIYAGADGWSDVGPPLHGDLMRGVLVERLTDESTVRSLAAPARDAAEHFLSTLPVEYLGSMLRELFRPQGQWASKAAEINLNSQIQRAITRDRKTGGMVARAITLLAFTFRALDRDARVITAHYDDDILDAENNRHRYYPWLRTISYVDCRDHAPHAGQDQVPLLRINGRPGEPSAQSLVVGEADYVSDEPVSAPREASASEQAGHTPLHVPRELRLRHELTERSVLFVGTSLRDPGVLSALADTRHSEHPRFAVLRPPPSTSDQPDARAWMLWLLGQRYLHLGVVPIFVDFPRQVPQFLNEIALCARPNPAPYLDHSARLERWWNLWAAAFGFSSDGDWIGGADRDYRKLWRARLETAKEVLAVEDLGRPDATRNERLRFDLWLRNQARREMFLWTTSARQPASSLPPDTLHLRTGPEPNPTLAAFRTGETYANDTNGPGPWRYAISMNLVLYDSRWRGLTVGIITARSTHTDGILQGVGDHPDRLREFEGKLLEHLRPLAEFRPEGSVEKAEEAVSMDPEQH